MKSRILCTLTLLLLNATSELAHADDPPCPPPYQQQPCDLPANVGGRWSEVYFGTPLYPYGLPEQATDVGHAVLLRNGLILAVDGGGERVYLIEMTEGPQGRPIVHGPYPAPRHIVPPNPTPQLRQQLFCSGHCQLADGNIFGSSGISGMPLASRGPPLSLLVEGI